MIISNDIVINCNAAPLSRFWRQIVRDKNSIVRDIVWDCAILRQAKYLVSHSLSKQTLNFSSHTFSFAITLSLSNFTSAAFNRNNSLKCRTYFKLILCLLKLSDEQKKNTRGNRPIMHCKPLMHVMHV